MLLAVHRLGLRAAVLDPGAGPAVLRARLALACPDVVVADAAAQAAATWARPLARRAQVVLPDLAALGPVATVGPRLPGCAPALDTGVRAAALPRPVDDDGDAVIVFTSGTTARPRAVVHSRSSVAARHGNGDRSGAAPAGPTGPRRHLLRARPLSRRRRAGRAARPFPPGSWPGSWAASPRSPRI
ncbi:hypothetical protein GCM10020000_81590 [Streptomyces olivoverticillatus]